MTPHRHATVTRCRSRAPGGDGPRCRDWHRRHPEACPRVGTSTWYFTHGRRARCQLRADPRDGGSLAACAEALSLPIADRSVDIAVCSQLLHHFHDDDVVTVLRELDRVAIRRVIVSDLRRSWTAAAGFWLASVPLRFHAVSRHDGVVSVLRAFSATELSTLMDRAVCAGASVRRRLGFRLVASWQPGVRSATTVQR